MSIPIYTVIPELREMLRSNTAVVLEAAPGAGKTTRVPLALLDEDWMGGGRILMLEPRRLAARLAAVYMAETLLKEPVGKSIGYRTRFDSCTGPGTRIEVVTDGVFIRLLQEDPGLAGVGMVIFDEFHERSLAADLGLAMVLDAQQSLRPELRLLIMSATIAGERIATFLDHAPLLGCPGREYPVETYQVPLPRGGKICEAAVRTVRQALGATAGGILVFLPGAGEIRQTETLLNAAELPAGVTVHPLYSSLEWERQRQAVAPCRPGCRKIVLATNIAQTSLTLEGIEAVIDSGLSRVPMFDPGSGMTRLVTARVSRDAADQRRGRAGRLGPGKCWRLWSSLEDGTLPARQTPEILGGDLTELVLELAAWGVTEPGSLKWLDPPAEPAFMQARYLLQSLEAVDAVGQITEHGRRLVRLGAPARLAHLMLKAKAMNCPELGAAVAAILSERDFLSSDSNASAQAPADLLLRIDVLHDNRAGTGHLPGCRVRRETLSQVKAVYHDFRRRLGCKRSAWSADELAQAGILTAMAYPERVARKRSGAAGVYLLRSGQGAVINQADLLAREEFLAIASTDGRPDNAKVFLAVAVDRESIEKAFVLELRTERRTAWDAGHKSVRAREVTFLGQLPVSEKPVAAPDPAEIIIAMLEGIRIEGLGVLPWSRAAEQLRARIAFMRRLGNDSDDWPELSDQTLLDNLEDWLAPWLTGMKSLTDLRRLNMESVLKGLLPMKLQTRLEREAPCRLQVPGGSCIQLDYQTESAPVLAVKLQEMFGQQQTPRIAGGRVPVLLHLLAPGKQPVQVTDDLASFWKNTYFQVRKDWRGRYPKHPWPENPETAAPTRKTNAQLRAAGNGNR